MTHLFANVISNAGRGVGFLCHDRRHEMILNRPYKAMMRACGWSLVAFALWSPLAFTALRMMARVDRLKWVVPNLAEPLVLISGLALIVGLLWRFTTPLETDVPAPDLYEVANQ